MQQNEILQQSLEQAQAVLQEGGISVRNQKDIVLKYIHLLYQDLKNATRVVESLEDSDLWQHIVEKVDHSQLLTSKKIEILTSYVHGPAPLCHSGNTIRYQSYAVGYVMCGPASRCECTKQAVAEKVSKIKNDYNDDRRQEIQKKMKSTTLARYGVENVFENTELIQASVEKKYGVKNVNRLPEVRQKIARTNQEKYGGVAPAASQLVKDRMTATNQKKYGVDHASQFPETMRKQQQTMLDRYGVTSPIKNPDIARRMKSTNLERYGYENAAQNQQVKDQIRNSTRSSYLKNLIDRLTPHNIVPVKLFNTVEDHEDWLCNTCSTQFKGFAFNGRVPRCYTCYPASISGPQQEIADFLIQIIGRDGISLNNRKLLENAVDRRRSKEIDILLPEYQLGIEYCGLKWHTEISGGRGRSYHYDKFKQCQNLGIQLVTIYSDEWESNRALLKSMIRTRMGLSNKLYARKLKVAPVDTTAARVFFESNHIQGYVKSSSHYGLFDNDQLVMCLAVSKPRYNDRYSLEITRLASLRDTVVVGGASRLFSALVKDKNPVTVLSYCDLRYGTGTVYCQLGFAAVGKPTIGSDYVEVQRANRRYNRLHYQKHKLGNTNGLSERDYLYSIGFERVYDCGHQKFVWSSANSPTVT